MFGRRRAARYDVVMTSLRLFFHSALFVSLLGAVACGDDTGDGAGDGDPAAAGSGCGCDGSGRAGATLGLAPLVALLRAGRRRR
jgi:hypothetical protein